MYLFSVGKQEDNENYDLHDKKCWKMITYLRSVTNKALWSDGPCTGTTMIRSSFWSRICSNFSTKLGLAPHKIQLYMYWGIRRTRMAWLFDRRAERRRMQCWAPYRADYHFIVVIVCLLCFCSNKQHSKHHGGCGGCCWVVWWCFRGVVIARKWRNDGIGVCCVRFVFCVWENFGLGPL